jgi:hypothetical protein
MWVSFLLYLECREMRMGEIPRFSPPREERLGHEVELFRRRLTTATNRSRSPAFERNFRDRRQRELGLYRGRGATG